jgi:hypothetical protein
VKEEAASADLEVSVPENPKNNQLSPVLGPGEKLSLFFFISPEIGAMFLRGPEAIFQRCPDVQVP